jgi:endonuclease V-like protein UPF0215 family
MAKEKSNSDRILRIYELCVDHFGDCRFVGIKYHAKMGWIAKAQFNGDFENLTADGEDATDALRNLKNRVKKIIKRYNGV